jgi:hypothetical protein
MATVVKVITSLSSFKFAYTIPADFAAGSTLQVECIGGGGFANSSGGGYSKTNAITGITAGQTVYIQASIGVDSWLNKTSNAAPTLTTDGCLAKGGTFNGASLPQGGQASAGVGDVKFSGGNGGAYILGCPTSASGGGGGAAGPNGNGANASTTGTGTGGGGANGGSAGTLTNGGNGRGGSGGGTYSATGTAGNGTNGGGGGGTASGTPGYGGPDLIYTDTVTGIQWGPSGGGGGNTNGDQGAAGGGACRLSDVGTAYAGAGIVVLTYTSSAGTGNFFQFF